MHGKRFAFFSMLLLLLSLSPFASTIGAGSEVHDVAVINVTAWPTVTLPGVLYINATVENQGTSNETFNLTAYADNLTIQTVTVTDLAPGLSETLTITWELFPFRIMIFPPPWPLDEPMIENLTIWVEADVVAGEVGTFDNVYIDGTVTIIWWPPDVDGDGMISIFDIAMAAIAFGSCVGDPQYNAWVDFNQDGKNDIYDIATTAMIFGATYA